MVIELSLLDREADSSCIARHSYLDPANRHGHAEALNGFLLLVHAVSEKVADNEKDSIGSAPAEECRDEGRVGPEHFG